MNLSGIPVKQKLFPMILVGLLMVISACAPKPVNTQIQVQLWHNGNPLDCQAIALDEQQWQLDSFAFYLSDASLMTDQQSYPMTFYSDVPQLQLLRFDAESCQGQVTLRTAKPLTSATALAFTLGVPFALNHGNPVTQPMPLNVPDMFWTWRNGYKFLRVDMHSQQDNWAYHLGSVGCVADSAVRAPKMECAKPNRSRFEVAVPQGESLALVLHLDRLLKNVSVATRNRCVMHGDKEPVCEQLFENLTASEQPVFSLEALH